jgi:predicted aspartyl protease
MLMRAKETQMGRIVTQVRLTNFTDSSKTLAVSALVDTGSAYITLPNAWRESLGDVEQLGEVELELADQTVKRGIVCGPLRVRIGEFRPIVAEVLFLDMEPDEDGEYEPLVGYIALEQAGAAVDMLGHRLVHVKRVDLK